MITKPSLGPQHFIVIFGPPATGKTLNRDALKKHYRCDHVFDDVFDDHRIKTAGGRILILSNEQVRQPLWLRKKLEGVTRISVQEAAAALGSNWIAPLPGYALGERECFKHLCRACGAVEFVRRASSADYPSCCGKRMAYIGIVTAKPGRVSARVNGTEGSAQG